jgi:hypothetical protein
VPFRHSVLQPLEELLHLLLTAAIPAKPATEGMSSAVLGRRLKQHLLEGVLVNLHNLLDLGGAGQACRAMLVVLERVRVHADIHE